MVSTLPTQVSLVREPGQVIGERWRLGAAIGGGGQGSVHLAYDVRRGRNVAAKLVPFTHDSVRELKREFRILASIRHPNVVRALDLYVADSMALASMEWIDGVTLDRHLAPLREHEGLIAATRTCFAGLMRALTALHEHGIAHRDIKPANILVTADGHVVLVDLGLARINRAGAANMVSGVSGTLAYMAPEQFWSMSTDTTVDIYGAAAAIVEAALGSLPWERNTSRFNAAAPPPDLRDVAAFEAASGLPLTSMLADDPKRRPSAAAALASIGAARARSSEIPEVLVGRAEELDRIATSQQLSASAARVMVVEGEPGIGKTLLVSAALDRLGSTLVLRHRCHPRETLPFQGLDGIVDEVARTLRLAGQLPSTHTWSSLARTFPAVADALGHMPPSPAEQAAPDVLEDAGRALADVLAMIADNRSVAVWIDDWHWGDRDSARILAAAIAASRPMTWWILSCRPSAATEVIVRQAVGAAITDRIQLKPLEAPTCQRWLEMARPDLSAEVRASWLATAGGWPLHIAELVRSSGPGVNGSAVDLLRERISRTSPRARDMLSVVGIASVPLAPEVLARLLPDAVQDTAEELVDARLLTWLSDDSGPFRLRLYHDLVREAAVDTSDKEALRQLHGRLLAALEGHEHDGILFHHALEAGLAGRAMEHGRAAVAGALGSFAYDRATTILDALVALDPDLARDPSFLRDRAIALAGLGLGTESGETFLRAARVAPPALGLQLTRLAVEQLMGAGAYLQGSEVLRELLAAHSLPVPRPGLRGLIAALMLQRKVDREQRREARVGAPSDELLERLEILWVAGAGIGIYDSTAAFQLQFRHALLAARTNSDIHSALSLATQSLNHHWKGGDAGMRTGQSLLDRADWHAQRAGSPRAEAHVLLMRVTSHFLRRDFERAMTTAVAGERHCLANCPDDGWHIASFRWYQAHILPILGRMRELAGFYELRIRVAESRNDRFFLTNLRVGRPTLTHLASGRPEDVDRAVAWAESEASGSPYFTYQATLARGWALLYRGQARDALAFVESRKKLLRKQFLMGFQAVRIEVGELEALAALALRRELGAGSSLEKRVAKTCSRLEGEGLAWCEPHVARLRAELAGLRGDAKTRDALLGRASIGFLASGQVLDSRMAELAQSGDGDALHAMGIAEPRTFARIWHAGIDR